MTVSSRFQEAPWWGRRIPLQVSSKSKSPRLTQFSVETTAAVLFSGRLAATSVQRFTSGHFRLGGHRDWHYLFHPCARTTIVCLKCFGSCFKVHICGGFDFLSVLIFRICDSPLVTSLLITVFAVDPHPRYSALGFCSLVYPGQHYFGLFESIFRKLPSCYPRPEARSLGMSDCLVTRTRPFDCCINVLARDKRKFRHYMLGNSTRRGFDCCTS